MSVAWKNEHVSLITTQFFLESSASGQFYSTGAESCSMTRNHTAPLPGWRIRPAPLAVWHQYPAGSTVPGPLHCIRPTPLAVWRQYSARSIARLTSVSSPLHCIRSAPLAVWRQYPVSSPFHCPADVGIRSTATARLTSHGPHWRHSSVAVRPLSVKILGSSRASMQADRSYELVCHTVGSRPPANVTWWIGERRLLGATLTVRHTWALWTSVTLQSRSLPSV